ncbi:Ras family, other [Sporothrix brasiliensis 5110]|uniref:Ras family, other n=1 Tax=Sporothrix brasiliensis 5110 TaxID=1398154 RepID=A0A0C2J5I6_9PEZI|nr:Ras family, other [Sporothrix brasiliensis 5110]KIH94250.1 Ras family, other [Sporothrix brasiliensis 5110]
MGLYKLAMLGDSGVGKTSLYDPSILESFLAKALVDDESCVLEILDTGGQEDDLCLEIQSSDGFVLVYDTSSRSSFSRVNKIAKQIQHMENFASQSADFHDLVTLILVGNKCDLDREVSSKEGQKLATKLNCGFIETSAKSGTNVEKAFISITRTLKTKKDIQTTAVEGGLLPKFITVLLGPFYSCFGF